VYSYFLRFLRLGYRPNLDVHVGLVDLARCNPELALRAIMELEPSSCPEIFFAEIAVPRLNLDPFHWLCRHSPPYCPWKQPSAISLIYEHEPIDPKGCFLSYAVVKKQPDVNSEN
jgi:hypothetical protein